jgi:3-hydroxymyristoyl/3-hydroxydecanoyl-(acyl carrier protein) dehydratase
MNVLVIIVHRSEEPALTNMDISTGHMVLVSYVTLHHQVLTCHLIFNPSKFYVLASDLLSQTPGLRCTLNRNTIFQL